MGTDILINVVVRRGDAWKRVNPQDYGLSQWPLDVRDIRMFWILLGDAEFPTLPPRRGWGRLVDDGVFPPGFDINDDLNWAEKDAEVACWDVGVYGQSWLDILDLDQFAASGGYDIHGKHASPIHAIHEWMRQEPTARIVFSFDQPI